jgi:predicted DNA-binding protein (MmcQ/YjbR family)
MTGRPRAKKATAEKTSELLQAHALSLPEAWMDHPWEETVIKVRKKIFVFFGTEGDPEPGFGLKLVESHGEAMSLPCVTPSGYGLGKSGWVSIKYSPDLPPPEVLVEWIEESYQLVAPKTLGRLLDADWPQD